MPRRAALLVLVTATAVGDCANPHAGHPVAEMRPGITPITSEVRYGATYALHRTDEPGEALYTTHLVRGERVGFRREADRSVVAVASGQTLPLGEGTFAWVMAEGSVPTWRERAGQDCRDVAVGVGTGLAAAGIVLACVAGAVVYGLAQGAR